MNQQQPIHRRRLTRAEIRRRRRNRAIRRIAGLTLVVCVAVGGVSFLLSHRKAPVPTADAAGSAANSAASSLPLAAPSSKAESSAVSGAAAESVESRDNLLGLTAAEAKAMLADPLMILVNHTNKMPENYTFETAECGSKTAVNKTLQTVACNAFLELQKAAAAENVTVWMQSGYRSVSYQTNLYEKKTNYYKQQGYDDAKAKEMAAAIVNPPGYSEHNCGLAADLNSPEHTGLDEGFEKTAAGCQTLIPPTTPACWWFFITRRISAGFPSTPGSTGSSCATPRGPRRRPRSPTSPGTGAMWAWKMPQRSTPAACALRSISRLCRASPPRAESTGEEKVKISRFVCNSAVDMVDYLGVLGRQFSGRPGLRILTTKEGNLL